MVADRDVAQARILGQVDGDGRGLISGLAQQGGDDGAQMATAFGGVGEQALAVGRGLDQPILSAKAPGMTLLSGQFVNVLGVFDTLRLVEAARVGGDDVRTVEDAHLVERREDDEGVAHMGVRHAIVGFVEPGVWGLSDGDLEALVGGEAVTGQRDERAALLLEGLANADGAVFEPGTVGGDAVAPGLGLGVEIVDIAP